MGDAIVQTVQVNGGFQGSTFNVVGESLKYCVVMVLMAIICFQAPSLASALTGGAAEAVDWLQQLGARFDGDREGPHFAPRPRRAARRRARAGPAGNGPAL